MKVVRTARPYLWSLGTASRPTLQPPTGPACPRAGWPGHGAHACAPGWHGSGTWRCRGSRCPAGVGGTRHCHDLRAAALSQLPTPQAETTPPRGRSRGETRAAAPIHPFHLHPDNSPPTDLDEGEILAGGTGRQALGGLLALPGPCGILGAVDRVCPAGLPIRLQPPGRQGVPARLPGLHSVRTCRGPFLLRQGPGPRGCQLLQGQGLGAVGSQPLPRLALGAPGWGAGQVITRAARTEQRPRSCEAAGSPKTPHAESLSQPVSLQAIHASLRTVRRERAGPARRVQTPGSPLPETMGESLHPKGSVNYRVTGGTE